MAGAAPAGPECQVPLASPAPVIDGRGTEAAWARAEWRPLDQRWLGPATTAADFSGRYKVVWTPERLYVLAEITDDVEQDTHADPLERWWDDDCLEIFVDPDRSRGEHQYNHNAWAYHVALDGHVVDLGRDRQGHLFDEHVRSRRTRRGQVSTWEAAVALYPDTYDEHKPAASRPLPLRAGQPIGFALAYCDNDGSAERENFFGSEPVAGADKNRGWIDAGIFGRLRLVPPAPSTR
ncbi:sugar-binding protein [Solirubrum puertoriconensis]|uniref:Sugar-binding protein n=1 Tax=Solirubrum puertoriconensis TaxID=1751427 RepID=A0A9X0HNA3_SOLP1|nr:sugar-binding protein [Solirubrum puertoriconensis]